MVSRSTLAAMLVAFAFFMYGLDSTVVTTALPQIAIAFAVSPVRLSIVITAYLLSVAVFIPVSGWLADRFGARTVFCAAIGVFTLGSVLCGFSNGIVELTASRILQGIGGAMMIPVGRLVALRTVPKSEFIQTMAYVQVVGQLGPMLGPPVGGFFTTYLSWRWIFLINLPIGALGMFLVYRFIGNHRESERRPFDWIGFILCALSLSGILYGLELLGTGTADYSEPAACLGSGVVLGAVTVWHCRRHTYPLIDVSLFQIPSFRVNATAGTLFRVAAAALPFLLPLLFQVAFGMTAFQSGLLTFCSAIGAALMRWMTRPLFRKLGFRTALVVNGLVFALIIFLYTLFTKATPIPLVIAALFLGGLCQSLGFTALTTLPYADIPPAKISASTSFAQLIQQIGMVSGVAAGAVLLHFSLRIRGAEQLATTDIRFAFCVVGASSLLSILFFLGLAPDAGAEMSGHRPRTKAAPAIGGSDSGGEKEPGQ